MKNTATLLCSFSLAAAAGLPTTASAQSLGSAFTYQGKLTEAGAPANGLFDLQVCAYASALGSVLIGCAPDLADVPVEDGLITVSLDFGAAVFVGQERFLELRVRPGASTGNYTILTPRQLVRPTPEALRANVSSAAPWSGLTGVPAGFADGIDNVGSGTVTSVSAGTGLSGGTITGSGTIGIANAGVGSAQIAANAVDSSRIVDASVSAADLASNAVGSSELADNAVDTAAVQNLAITQGKIASGAVGSTQLANGAVGSTQLAAGAVGAAQINTAQVQTRIAGTCAVGEYFRGINADGSVACESVLAYLGINLITTVDNAGQLDVGRFTAIAVGSDRLPVISYTNVSQAKLRVAKCSNTACTGTATITTIDVQGIVADEIDIAIGSTGLPVISFYEAQADALMVARCSNSACTGAATLITTIDDPANLVGRYSAIAIGSDGRPVISYQDMSAGALKVAKCSNAACTGVATITTIDDPANVVGEFTDIAIGNDGLPVISYYDSTAFALKVAKCLNAACTGATLITTVDDPVNAVGQWSSIAIGNDGLPVISYYDATAAALKVAKCSNAGCTGVANTTTVDASFNGVGRFTAIAVDSDNLPVISYYDATAALKVAKCGNAGCTGVTGLDTVFTTVDDPANSVGTRTAIAVDSDGLPVISYYDFTAGALKVAKCGSRSCQ